MPEIDVAKFKRRVKGPGKFEGEKPATAYFYDLWLDGDGEAYFPYADEDLDDEPEATLFQIDADEADAFGLEVGHWYIIWEDGTGFAYGFCFETREEAEEKFDDWLGR